MFNNLKSILSQFLVAGKLDAITAIEIGHINETYKVTFKNEAKEKNYVLQKINVNVFKKPYEVMENIVQAGQFLTEKNYPKEILLPLKTIHNQYIVEEKGKHWRLFPYIENTITYDLVDTPDKAYSAAFAFGEYARYLRDLDAQKLHYTIPNFHNTPLRYEQFFKVAKAYKNDDKEVQRIIETLHDYRYLLDALEKVELPLRAVHSDTKINNILFDENTDETICVIDLDTLMPGYLIYDYGDMVRTFTPTLDENSDNFKEIAVRQDILNALSNGYLDGLLDSISGLEKRLLNYGATLIIYEQALRFLTDYLQGNSYYKVAYEQQNLVRAKNQVCLLDDLLKSRSN